MKKITLLLLLSLLTQFASSQACGPCDNMDFEDGNLNCWIGHTGKSDYYNGRCLKKILGVCVKREKIPYVDNSTPGMVPGRQTIVTNGPNPTFIDPTVLSQNNPFTGNSSVKLGNEQSGRQAESIERTFLISTTNKIFTYYYAIVMQDPGHGRADQPFFRIEMYDGGGDVIPCGSYWVQAGSSLPGFASADAYVPGYFGSGTMVSSIIYKRWTQVNVDLSAYIGQNVRIKFTTGDCIQGAHFGYAYVDASCEQPELLVDETCQGTELVATGGAPLYEWRNLTTGTLLPETSNRLAVTTSGTYEVTIVNETGCNIKFDTTIAVSFFPVESIINTTDNLCASDSLGTISINTTGGVGIPYQYSIDSGATFSNSPNFINLPAGTYYVIAKDINDCGDTNTIIITAQDTLKTNVIPTPVNCFGGNDGEIEFTNLQGGTLPYQFSINQGITYSTNPLFQTLNQGVYYTEMKDANNCYVRDTVEILAPDSIIVNIPNDTTICIDGTATFSTSAIGGTPPFTFNWGGATIGTLASFMPAKDTVINLIAIDSRGCVSPVIKININVLDSLKITALNDTSICMGTGARIRAVNPSGGDSSYVYSWDNGIGNVQYDNVVPNATTTYTVTLADGCETPPVTDQVSVTIFPYPDVLFSVDKETGCIPLVVNFTNDTDPTLIGNCVWEMGDGTQITGCNPFTHIYDSVGCFDVSLTVISPNGCQQSKEVVNQICTYPLPIAMFNYNPNPGSVLQNEIQFNNLSILGDSYNWNFSGLGTSTDINPIYTFSNEKGDVYDVCLEAITINNCRDTICVPIKIDEKLLLYVPNTFTPDGDGRNDIFIPSNQGANPSDYEFTVFDRWGDIVFYSEEKTKGWDGNKDGSPCKEDTYVWQLKTSIIGGKGEKKLLRGHINLVR